jgi:hypothetical protein
MKKVINITALAIMLLSTSCSNTIDKKIDIKTIKEDLTAIKKDYAKEYTEKDFDAVGKLLMGKFMGAALSGDKDANIKIEQTYKEVLDEAKAKRLVQEKEELDYQAKLAELKKVIEIGITKTEIKKVGDYIPDEYLVIYYTVTNKSKNIKGWNGSLIVKDMFDKKLGNFEFEQKDLLKEGETIKQEAGYKANYEPSFTEIGTTDIAKLKFVFEPEIILFEDGSKLEIPARKTE